MTLARGDMTLAPGAVPGRLAESVMNADLVGSPDPRVAPDREDISMTSPGAAVHRGPPRRHRLRSPRPRPPGGVPPRGFPAQSVFLTPPPTQAASTPASSDE